MKRRLINISFFIGFIIVSISPFFDSVIVMEYDQVEHHRLGFPLPIIEQHTTLTPLYESFPFELGLLDPREHPTEILLFNYIFSILSISLIVYLLFRLLKKMVGFIMHAYEEETTNMYWINGFIIDERFQGKGYGKAALTEMIKWIQKRFPKCTEIRLTVFQENHVARALYKNFGFLPTGEVWGEEEVLFLHIH